jgi:hypothetical protein
LLQIFDKGVRTERAAGAGMRVQQVSDVRRGTQPELIGRIT